MKIEDIIEGLNRHIEEERRLLGIHNRGHIVMNKVMIPHPKIKAYKTCTANVVYVSNKDKIKIDLGSIVITDRVLKGQENQLLSNFTKDLIQLIIKFSQSELYNKVLYNDTDK